VEVGEVRAEPPELVHHDAPDVPGGHAGVRGGHRYSHLRLLHQAVVADERADQHLLGLLVHHEVEGLDELGPVRLDVRGVHAVERADPGRPPVGDAAVGEGWRGEECEVEVAGQG
jgi:hypothetical protein